MIDNHLLLYVAALEYTKDEIDHMAGQYMPLPDTKVGILPLTAEEYLQAVNYLKRWEAAPYWADHVAKDENGGVWWYEYEPIAIDRMSFYDGGWSISGMNARCSLVENFHSEPSWEFMRLTHWRDTLEHRPFLSSKKVL